MSATEHLNDLHRLRLEWVRTTRDNGFEGGIRNLLTELYPDEAHFIYELLQNAEDARATSVSFHLTRSGVVLTHNGRDFDAADVESITRIGESTKTDDVNQIGKFGVGFKAVFAYTETPRVQSGSYAFEIQELVCPVALPDAQPTPGTTRFEFPFNHSQKPADQAYQETAEGLQGLSPETLLFLTNVQEITWCVDEDAWYGHLQRMAEEANHIKIVRQVSEAGEPETTEWLRFQSPLETSSKLNVAVAFRLERGRKIPQDAAALEDQEEGYRVVPIQGKLFLFFPAEKETTSLRFHVHGPYASTVARDSVKHTREDNQQLLGRTAQLLAMALPSIRDIGLLTTDFLAVLPNHADNLPAFYEPIREAVVGAMQNEALVPTFQGGHAPAKVLLKGPRALKLVIDDELIPFFQGATSLQVRQWAAGAMENRPEDLLIETLGIPTWSWEQLKTALAKRFEFSTLPVAANWLSARSDEWMHRFYALLESGVTRGLSLYSLQQCLIVRLQSGEHVRASDAYFPPDDQVGSELTSTLPYIAPGVLTGRRERVERVRSLLTRLGAKTAGEWEEIKAILESFYQLDSPNPKAREHLAHLRRFITWWRENDSEIFTDYYLFRGGDGELFVQPEGLYIDAPFEDTDLASLVGNSEDYLPLWAGYLDAKVTGLIEFAAELGALRHLPVERKRIDRTHPDHTFLLQDSWKTRRTEYTEDQDYTITGLSDYLARGSLEVSRCVWNSVLSAPRWTQEAHFRANGSWPRRSKPSSLVYQLRQQAWIPGTDGLFHLPADLTLEEVHPSLRRQDPNGWLLAIGLGESVQQRKQAYQARREAAERIGVPVELADKIAGLDEDVRERVFGQILDLLDHSQRSVFPDRESANPERRSARLAATAAESPARKYQLLDRSVRVSNREAKEQAREYLRDLYTNHENVMVCQVCEYEMPFKLADGEYYFEAVQFLALSHEHRENYLALCPVCAAMFKYANGSTPESLCAEIIESASLILPVELARKQRRIRFVGPHVADLRTLLAHSSVTDD